MQLENLQHEGSRKEIKKKEKEQKKKKGESKKNKRLLSVVMVYEICRVVLL